MSKQLQHKKEEIAMSTFFKDHKLGFASALVLTASLAFCFVIVNHTSDGNESAGNTDVSENMVEEAMPFATGDEVVTENRFQLKAAFLIPQRKGK